MNKFGKMVDGKPELLDWRSVFVVDGVSIHSRAPEFLLSQGYKPVIFNTPETRVGYVADSFSWEETDAAIVRVWNYSEYTGTEEDVLEKRVNDMSETISMLTDCLLEMSEIIYA